MSPNIDLEKIAAQIHQFYCDQAVEQGWKNEFAMPFPELPEFMKEDNRAAARRIGQVLSVVGLRLQPRSSNGWSQDEQNEVLRLIEQNIDLLAEGEHDGWTLARLRQGWRLGPRKDITKRESHLLVDWSQFPEQIKIKQEQEQTNGRPPRKTVEQEVEEEKNKDRESVRNYVRIIAQTEYCIGREE